MGVILKEGVIKDLSVGDVTIPCRSPTQLDGNLSKVWYGGLYYPSRFNLF